LPTLVGGEPHLFNKRVEWQSRKSLMGWTPSVKKVMIKWMIRWMFNEWW
jgi:hypothetical protein